MEGKKDSGVLAQMKRTVEAIWAGKHYILAWGMFFTWLYLLGYSMDTFLSDSGFGKAIFFIIMIISIIVFVSFHNEVKENIDNNGIAYYSVIASLLIVVVFFNAEPDDSGVFSQPTLANFGTFFGGILTPIGILIAVTETIRKRKLEMADNLAEEFISDVNKMDNELSEIINKLYEILKVYKSLDKDDLNKHDLNQLHIEYGFRMFAKKNNVGLMANKVDDIVIAINTKLPGWSKYKTPEFIRLELVMKSVKEKGDVAFKIIAMAEEQVVEDLNKRMGR